MALHPCFQPQFPIPTPLHYKDLNFEKGSANSAFKVVSVAVQGTFLGWVECMGFPEHVATSTLNRTELNRKRATSTCEVWLLLFYVMTHYTHHRCVPTCREWLVLCQVMTHYTRTDMYPPVRSCCLEVKMHYRHHRVQAEVSGKCCKQLLGPQPSCAFHNCNTM